MVKANIKVIKAGRLIDGTGKLPLENAMVLIEDTKIKAVGKDIEIPEEAWVIDATGKTVMPGMIDAHMHYHGMRGDDNMMEEEMARPRELETIKAVLDAKKYFASGFTTTKDCGGMNGVYLRQAAAEKILTGIPRIVASGYEIKNTQSHPYNYMPVEYLDARTSRLESLVGKESIYCDGVDECIKAARFAFNRGADFLKLINPGNEGFNYEELQAFVQTAAQVKKFVTAHSNTGESAKSSIKAGVKTIDHAIGIDEEAVEMGIKAGTIFVSTLAVMRALIDYGHTVMRKRYTAEMAKANIGPMIEAYKLIRKMGGTLAIGTDIGGESLCEYIGSALEIELLASYVGYTPMEAIMCATKNAAMACFIGDKTGTIEPGKFADIIVVDGDPLMNVKILQEIDKIKMVMLEGKVEINK
jgi:imidazolonepropionase-like amidohydrolase